MSIVFSTCWYALKAKFPETTYKQWIDNMLSSVVQYKLVLYTDSTSFSYFSRNYGNNPNIKIVVKPFENFYNYKHREFWIRNHDRNNLLKDKVGWEVNMLWSEKVHFVEETKNSNYFPKADYYGWIDIGYFRCRPYYKDVSREQLREFPNPKKIRELNPAKIHYGLINTNMVYIEELIALIRQGKNIPANQTSIGGGFFIGHERKIEEWKNRYTETMEMFITENRLIKDDQIILAQSIFTNLDFFELHVETQEKTDPWFLFSRKLL